MLLTVRAKNLEELHSVAIEKIGKIEGIQNTETFVELQRTEKDQSYELKE
jgi:Lrp/AsnC family transcriptional regulator for asnA, asnC and gidA